jgi:hypothetical protein
MGNSTEDLAKDVKELLEEPDTKAGKVIPTGVTKPVAPAGATPPAKP